MFDEAAERKSFEDTAYSEYMANENAQRLAHPRVLFKASMPKELFLKHDDNGKYMLIGLDAGWWAWKARAKLVHDAILRERSLPGYVGPNKPTCGNCKYRGDELIVPAHSSASQRDEPTGFFECGLIMHDKALSSALVWPTAQPEFKGTGAVVTDGSGYHAALCVEEDFACNRWQAKE